ncbi:MAG TPA: RNA repair domain-containing protein [Burkholderiales bacterium]|nr:RNA repair domain-containing protein [Burkholderiales bacterium]
MTRKLVRVPLQRIRFPSGEHFAFEALEDDGAVHSVPLHRVREVWRDGRLIWECEAPLPKSKR